MQILHGHFKTCNPFQSIDQSQFKRSSGIYISNTEYSLNEQLSTIFVNFVNIQRCLVIIFCYTMLKIIDNGYLNVDGEHSCGY